VAALATTGLDRLVVAGGVGANRSLRSRLDRSVAARGARVHYPELDLCTDNGAMIALAGAMRLAGGDRPDAGGAFDVRPRWPLETLGAPR
jgi:N6-L-threonylcarbamoyladenine synthase